MSLTGRHFLRAATAILVAVVYTTDASPAAPSKQTNGQVECTTEQHRPRFHFSAKRNWINDPNGMVFFDGIYHLYYQHAPNSMTWDTMHWGSAASRDLVSWEEQPIAIYPDDELGPIYSGSCVIDSQNTTGFKPPNGPDPIVAIFTQDKVEQRQSLAHSLDNGLTFTKYEGNPVLERTTDTWSFRDPKVFFNEEKGEWVMVIAAENRMEFYSSPDLKSWSKESAIGNDPKVGPHDTAWECPDLLPFDVEIDGGQKIKVWVLLVSVARGAPNRESGTFYFIGNFTTDARGNVNFQNLPWHDTQWLDWGPDNYAGVTFSNVPSDRKIYMAWMDNWAYARDTPNLSHRGQMTIPRQLGVRVMNDAADGLPHFHLTSSPVSELDSLRNLEEYVERQGPVTPGATVQLKEREDFENPLLELELNLEMKGNPEFYVCAKNDVEEEVCFGFQHNRWVLDRSRSGNTDFYPVFRNMLEAHAIREVNDEKVNIRIFLDVSSIEIFMDGGLATMTAQFFPTKPFDQVYMRHAGGSGTLTMEQVKIWGLKCWFNENN